MPKSSITLQTQCTNCSLKELCLPIGLNPEEFKQLDTVVKQGRRVKKGEFLFHTGEAFTSLFAIRTGFFKTTINTQDGRRWKTATCANCLSASWTNWANTCRA